MPGDKVKQRNAPNVTRNEFAEQNSDLSVITAKYFIDPRNDCVTAVG